MKKIINLLSIISAMAVLVTYSSCGGGGTTELPVTDQQLQKLIGTDTKFTWKCTSATLDGVDKTANYTSAFTITLSGTIGALATAPFSYSTSKPTFSSSESPLSPWAKSGTFTFDKDAPATKITRDDGAIVTYSVNETQLQVSFTFSPADSKTYDRTGGRTEVVKGAWIFNFKNN